MYKESYLDKCVLETIQDLNFRLRIQNYPAEPYLCPFLHCRYICTEHVFRKGSFYFIFMGINPWNFSRTSFFLFLANLRRHFHSIFPPIFTKSTIFFLQRQVNTNTFLFNDFVKMGGKLDCFWDISALKSHLKNFLNTCKIHDCRRKLGECHCTAQFIFRHWNTLLLAWILPVAYFI